MCSQSSMTPTDALTCHLRMAFCISWGPIDMPLDCCEAFEVYGVASVTKQKAHVARLVRRFKQKVRSRLQQP